VPEQVGEPGDFGGEKETSVANYSLNYFKADL